MHNSDAFNLAGFKDQAGHGINSRISAGDNGTGFTGPGLFDGTFNPRDFLGHAGADDLLAFDQRADQIDIGTIARYDLNRGENMGGPPG